MIYKQILAYNKSESQAHVGEAELQPASPQCSSVTPLRMSYSVGARSCSSRQAGQCQGRVTRSSRITS